MQLRNFCSALYSLHIWGVNTVQLLLQVHATPTQKLIVFSCYRSIFKFLSALINYKHFHLNYSMYSYSTYTLLKTGT
jgi:hypothetical protein